MANPYREQAEREAKNESFFESYEDQLYRNYLNGITFGMAGIVVEHDGDLECVETTISDKDEAALHHCQVPV